MQSLSRQHTGMVARTCVIAGAAALIAAGIIPWWMPWPAAVVLLSAIMVYEDAEVTRHMGTGSDAAAWGMLRAAGMIEQAVIASLATGVGMLAAIAARVTG
jgi:hypothetical protein